MEYVFAVSLGRRKTRAASLRDVSVSTAQPGGAAAGVGTLSVKEREVEMCGVIKALRFLTHSLIPSVWIHSHCT